MTLVRLFQCGFVLDDVYLIVNNRWLTGAAGSGQLLRSDLWAGEVHPDRASGCHRPVFYQAFGLTITLGSRATWLSSTSLFGKGVWSQHTVFSRTWTCPMRILPLHCLLHPLQTETTYWIVARNDTMALSFLALVLELWPNHPQQCETHAAGYFILAPAKKQPL